MQPCHAGKVQSLAGFDERRQILDDRFRRFPDPVLVAVLYSVFIFIILRYIKHVMCTRARFSLISGGDRLKHGFFWTLQLSSDPPGSGQGLG